MRMLLLVCGMALMMSPAVANPVHIQRSTPKNILHQIYDLAEKGQESITEEIFVEDVSDLTEGSDRCGDKFFCKVHAILHDNGKLETLVRALKVYNKGRNVRCEQAPEGSSSVEVIQTELSGLLEHVKRCVQHKNWISGF